MPTKTKEKIADFKPVKAVSVMVWIEVQFGRVLVLRSTQGSKLWPLPGDKVHSRESLISAAKRAVLKEEGLKIECSEYVGLLDRPQKPTLTFPFRAKLRAEARLTFPRRKRLNFSLQSGSATEICNATLIFLEIDEAMRKHTDCSELPIEQLWSRRNPPENQTNPKKEAEVKICS